MYLDFRALDNQGETIAFSENSSVKAGEENQDMQLLHYHIQNFITLSKTDLESVSIPCTPFKGVKAGVYSIRNIETKILWGIRKLVNQTEEKDQQRKLYSER